MGDLHNSQISTAKHDCLVVSARDLFYADASKECLLFWNLVGSVFIAVIAGLYYLVPLITFGLPIWVAFSRGSVSSVACLTIWIILAVLPPVECPRIRCSRLFGSMALYFDTQVKLETTVEKISGHQKPIVWLLFPHGIISFAGLSFGTMVLARPTRTAMADVLLRMPGIKQIFGVYGAVSGSRNSLVKQLRDEKVDLAMYPGGMAELFLSDRTEERLYFNQRKGCIKLALECGADIVVVYLFGNTGMYRSLKSPTVSKISRALRSSLTLFWGRWGTSLSHKIPVFVAGGPILSMPDFSSRLDELTRNIIDQEHLRIKSEILRVFESNKHCHPDYADKTLIIN